MKNDPTQHNNFQWRQCTLGDLLEKIEGGGTPSKENPNFWNGSIPWASVKDVVTHDPYDTQDHISNEGLNNSSSRIVPKGTLIVPTRMALGHAVTFNVDVAINQDLKALYPKKDLLNQYLFHWFSSKKKFIERLGSGSTVSGIQQSELKKIKFNLPSLPEQKRIVAVLETWDQAIEKLTRKIEIKKEVKKGLMQELLTSKTRLTGFCKSWKKFTLKETMKIYDGTHQTPDYVTSGIPFLSVEHISSNNFNDTKFITEEVYANESKRVMIQKGDILMTRIGSIGAIKYVDWDIKASFYVTLALLKVDKKFDAKSLSFFLSAPVFQKELWRRTLHVAFPNKINLNDIGKCKIFLPEDIEEQKAIGDILEESDNEIQLLVRKLEFLKDQKKYLLNNLITGTIRTPETLSIPN